MGLFNTFNRERAAYRSAARAADNSLRNKRAVASAGFTLASDVRGKFGSAALATGATFGAVGYAYNTATGGDGFSGATNGMMAGAVIGGARAAASLSKAGRDGRIIKSISQFNNRARNPSAPLDTSTFTEAFFGGMGSSLGKFNNASRSPVNRTAAAAKAANASGAGSRNTYAGYNARVVGDNLTNNYGQSPGLDGLFKHQTRGK
mgnify:FL=1